jgi:hypothetical protein
VFLKAICPELGEQVLELAESLAVEEQEPLVAAVQAAAVHGALHLGVGPVQPSGMPGTDYHIR